jgi:hypothetical protein
MMGRLVVPEHDHRHELSRDFKVPADLAKSKVGASMFVLGGLAHSFAIVERLRERGMQLTDEKDFVKFLTGLTSDLEELTKQIEAEGDRYMEDEEDEEHEEGTS